MICSNCREEKSEGDFYLYVNKAGKQKRKRQCASCVKSRVRSHYFNNPQPRRDYAKAWKLKNRSRANAYGRKAYAVSRSDLKSCIRKTLSTKKSQCKRWSIPYAISADDIVTIHATQGGLCALTGRKLVWGHVGWHRDGISIDRIRAELGYVAGNIRLVTYQVNHARSNRDDAELLSLALDIVSHSALPVAGASQWL